MKIDYVQYVIDIYEFNFIPSQNKLFFNIMMQINSDHLQLAFSIRKIITINEII